MGIKLTETVMDRVRRERAEREAEKEKALRKTKAEKLDRIGFVILVPILFFAMLAFYVFAWAVVPPSWW